MSEHRKRKNARAMLSKAGYSMGGHFAAESPSDKREDDNRVEKGVHQHEDHLHKGESKTRLKLADGGVAGGEKPKHRHDRKGRGHPHHKPHVQVNVIAGGGGGPKPIPVPVPMGGPPPGVLGAGPGGPPMGGPPGGPMPMPPPDMPPGAAAGGRYAKGGRIKELKAMMAKTPKDSGRDPIRGMPEGHFKNGGKTKKPYPIDDGAGGGEGRLEKAKAYGA